MRNLTTQKFGKLLAIKIDGKYNAENLWFCLCDCGKTCKVKTNNLTSGKTKSCGCLKKPVGESALNNLFSRYRSNAVSRKMDFLLTKEQLKELTSANCYYCNKLPSQVQKSHNGEYVYNGVDRLNNNAGYSLENCVSCCKACNFAKLERSKEEFLEHIKIIYNNFFGENNAAQKT